MSKKNSVEVVEKDNQGNEVTVVVKRPNVSQNTDAQIYSSQCFNKAIKAGALTRAKLSDYNKREGIWDDRKEKELKDLTQNIIKAERALVNKVDEKGKRLTKLDARELSIQVRRWRNEQMVLLLNAQQGDDKTAEGIAENAKMDYLISVCTFNEDGEKHFKDLDDYFRVADEDHPYVGKVQSEFYSLIYQFDGEAEKNRVENRVLRTLGFSDEEGRLTREDGKLVNAKGHLINEDGRLVNEEGELVDEDDNLVDEDGNPVCTSGYDTFLDE